MLTTAYTIREKRRACGYTQERLAQALGLTPAAVSKWETGQTLPDVTLLCPLAEALGITTDELLGFNPDVSEEQAEELLQPDRDALAQGDFSNATRLGEKAVQLHPSSATLAFATASLFMEIAQAAQEAVAASKSAECPPQESVATNERAQA